MIFDLLENCKRYEILHPRFAQAFEFMRRADLKTLTPGRHDIFGDEMYAIVVNEKGRKKEDGLLEAHEKYIDIQLILSNTDEIGWRSLSQCQKLKMAYDASKDVKLFSDEPEQWLRVYSGEFVVFFPQDAHLPNVSTGQIHKVVVKVPVR